MKKFLFLILILVLPSILLAESPSRIFPRPGSWTREVVGISSYMPTGTTNVTLSTQSAIDLLRINVTNPGTSSFIDVYDGRVSTSAVGIRYIGRFDTTSKITFEQGVAISSGLMVHNTGTTPAGVQVIYREHDFR